LAGSDPQEGEPTLENTAVLLESARGGDAQARERLVARFLPLLQRWAHGRLPSHARGLADTDDLVQVSLLRALDHLEGFEMRREGAFLAYLRRILMNSLRDEIRRSKRRPGESLDGHDLVSADRSLLEQQVGRDTMEAYEAALTRLTEAQREAVIMRLEFGYSYPQVAEAMGRTTPNAARMLVARALVQLAEEMDAHRR
jgi:RNA polymerase sigma-70 factor (ECF subfamily)